MVFDFQGVYLGGEIGSDIVTIVGRFQSKQSVNEDF